MSAGIVKASNSQEIFERQARICQAFAHPARLQILDLLGSREKGVSELQETLEISKTRISRHLTILKMIRKVLEAHIAESHRLIEQGN
jgi:DNA-binding transcriptional ArsR family regulator